MTDEMVRAEHLRSQLIAEMKKVFKEDSKRTEHALAACPNACTWPQIKDIGIIATSVPESSNCDRTGWSS